MKSRWILFASLLIGLGGWLSHFHTWTEFKEVSAWSDLLTTIGGILFAWFGKNTTSDAISTWSGKLLRKKR